MKIPKHVTPVRDRSKEGTVNVSEETLKKLKQLAKKSGHSMSGVVKILVDHATA